MNRADVSQIHDEAVGGALSVKIAGAQKLLVWVSGKMLQFSVLLLARRVVCLLRPVVLAQLSVFSAQQRADQLADHGMCCVGLSFWDGAMCNA